MSCLQTLCFSQLYCPKLFHVLPRIWFKTFRLEICVMFANTVLQSTVLPQALSCSPSDLVQNSSIENLCHVCKHCASVNCIAPSSFMFSLGFCSKLFDWKSVSCLQTLCFSQLHCPKLFHVLPRISFKTLRLEICVMSANTVLQSTVLPQALSCSPSDLVQNSSTGNLCHICQHCASVNCITPSSFMFALGFCSKLFDWKSVSCLQTHCFSQLHCPKLFHVLPRILFKTLRLEICVMFANTVLQANFKKNLLECVATMAKRKLTLIILLQMNLWIYILAVGEVEAFL